MIQARLSQQEIECLIRKFKEIFADTDELWLFGSRVDMVTKGGDIDLFIKLSKDDDDFFAKKIRFLANVKSEIGEQKIDVVIQTPSSQHQTIFNVAVNKGVRLT